MSTAHRPTWDPAQAREVKGGSRQYSSRDMASHTKLKFRQPGQTAAVDVAARDLRAELRLAEHTAKNKKRKAAGLAPLPFTAGPAMAAIEAPPADAEMGGDAEDPAAKRRKILEDALALDRDDEDDEDEDGPAASVSGAGAAADADGDSAMAGPGAASNTAADAAADDDDDDEDDEDDDEDETAQLLRELEKIKRERAAEQARVAAASDASAAADHEAEVARANPLLNLAAALGADTPKGVSTTVPGTFAVKRRWDDDVIFKNQAMNQKDKSGQFVNDLLRTEFHKKFMSKFIK